MSDSNFLALDFMTQNPLSTILTTPDGVPVYRVITSFHPFRSNVTTIIRYDGIGPRYPSLLRDTDKSKGIERPEQRTDGGTEIARIDWNTWPRLTRTLTLNGQDVNPDVFFERRSLRHSPSHVHTSQGTFAWTSKSEVKDPFGTVVAKIRSGRINFRPLYAVPSRFEFSEELDVALIDELVVAHVLRHTSLGVLVGVAFGSGAMNQLNLHIELATIIFS